MAKDETPRPTIILPCIDVGLQVLSLCIKCSIFLCVAPSKYYQYQSNEGCAISVGTLAPNVLNRELLLHKKNVAAATMISETMLMGSLCYMVGHCGTASLRCELPSHIVLGLEAAILNSVIIHMSNNCRINTLFMLAPCSLPMCELGAIY